MAGMIYTLADFINHEVADRKMSMRDFAKLVGVSPTTISDYAAGKTKQPDPKFLLKLATATNKSISAIIAIAYPEIASRTDPSARTILLAQRIESLPQDIQDYLLRTIQS